MTLVHRRGFLCMRNNPGRSPALLVAFDDLGWDRPCWIPVVDGVSWHPDRTKPHDYCEGTLTMPEWLFTKRVPAKEVRPPPRPPSKAKKAGRVYTGAKPGPPKQLYPKPKTGLFDELPVQRKPPTK